MVYMGQGFIIKNAQTYRLVPRSQQDPLAENVDEAQHVLKALQVQVRSDIKLLKQWENQAWGVLGHYIWWYMI